MVGVIAALLAAFAWTLASFTWRAETKSFNSLELNGIKNLLATIIFLPVLIRFPWLLEWQSAFLLFISGTVGIAIGDTLFFSALKRIGTRRTLTIDSMAPVLASLVGCLFMGEVLSYKSWFGVCLVSLSLGIVAIQLPAIPFRVKAFQRRYQLIGIIFAITAVICGVAGALISRYVLSQEILSPIQTSSIRLLGGLLVLTLLPLEWKNIFLSIKERSSSGLNSIFIATVLGTNLAILLQQIVFQNVSLGLGVTFLSTTPVISLLVASRERDSLTFLSFSASFTAFLGIALTFS